MNMKSRVSEWNKNIVGDERIPVSAFTADEVEFVMMWYGKKSAQAMADVMGVKRKRVYNLISRLRDENRLPRYEGGVNVHEG